MMRITRAKAIVAANKDSFSLFNVHMKRISELQGVIGSKEGIKTTKDAHGIYTLTLAPWRNLAHREQGYHYTEAKILANKINVAVSPADRAALLSATVFMMLTLQMKAAKQMESALSAAVLAREIETPMADGKI